MNKQLVLATALALAANSFSAEASKKEPAKPVVHAYDQATLFGYAPGASTLGIVHLDANYGETMWSFAAGVGAMGPGQESHGIFYLGYRYRHFMQPVSAEVSTWLGQASDSEFRQHQIGFYDHIYIAPLEFGNTRIKTHYDVYGYYSAVGDFWATGTGLKVGLGVTPFFNQLYFIADIDMRPGLFSTAVWEKGLGYFGELDTTLSAEWLVTRQFSAYVQWQNYWLFHKTEALELAEGMSFGMRYSWAFDQ